MPGTLTVNKFRSANIKSVAPTITTTSISGVRQSKQIAGQRWEIDLDFSSLRRDEFAQVMGFIAKQRNGLFNFRVVIPDISEPAGDITVVAAANPGDTTTMTITGNAAVGANTVSFDTAYTSAKFASAGADATKGLQAGDFIRFSNHEKVYQITDSVTFDASGSGDINFFPNLISAVTTSHTIVYQDVPFTVFSKTDTQEYSFGIGGENAVSISLQEAVGESFT